MSQINAKSLAWLVNVVESLASQALFNSEASLKQPKKQKLIAVRHKKKVPHL